MEQSQNCKYFFRTFWGRLYSFHFAYIHSFDDQSGMTAI